MGCGCERGVHVLMHTVTHSVLVFTAPHMKAYCFQLTWHSSVTNPASDTGPDLEHQTPKNRKKTKQNQEEKTLLFLEPYSYPPALQSDETSRCSTRLWNKDPTVAVRFIFPHYIHTPLLFSTFSVCVCIHTLWQSPGRKHALFLYTRIQTYYRVKSFAYICTSNVTVQQKQISLHQIWNIMSRRLMTYWHRWYPVTSMNRILKDESLRIVQIGETSDCVQNLWISAHCSTAVWEIKRGGWEKWLWQINGFMMNSQDVISPNRFRVALNETCLHSDI